MLTGAIGGNGLSLPGMAVQYPRDSLPVVGRRSLDGPYILPPPLPPGDSRVKTAYAVCIWRGDTLRCLPFDTYDHHVQ